MLEQDQTFDAETETTKPSRLLFVCLFILFINPYPESGSQYQEQDQNNCNSINKDHNTDKHWRRHHRTLPEGGSPRLGQQEPAQLDEVLGNSIPRQVGKLSTLSVHLCQIKSTARCADRRLMAKFSELEQSSRWKCPYLWSYPNFL